MIWWKRVCSNGTTKFQLGTTAINGTEIAVNEMPDGTAESIS